MTDDILNYIFLTYGPPAGFAVLLGWNFWAFIIKPKEDPNKEVLAALQDLTIRMTRVETILEERQ